MTEFLFRDDAYLRSTPARIISVNDRGLTLDRTVFYATSGGQPGDSGLLRLASGRTIAISGAIHPDGDKTAILHLPEGSATDLPIIGEEVVAEIDWERRYRLMRMHTALHLLSVVLPFPVTGGSIGEDKGRLDFDMPEVPGDLQALEADLNAMADRKHEVSTEWITDAEMAAQPGLVKTMKVKPPLGQGRVRLVRIGSVDLQPCGGTHVRNTSEIGALKVGKIENKGKSNRRVNLLFA